MAFVAVILEFSAAVHNTIVIIAADTAGTLAPLNHTLQLHTATTHYCQHVFHRVHSQTAKACHQDIPHNELVWCIQIPLPSIK